MKKIALMLMISTFLFGCKKEQRQVGTATYLIKADKPGMNITFYYLDNSQSNYIDGSGVTTFFRAESEEQLYVSAQSTQEDVCIKTYIIFRGDTVCESRSCGNYPIAQCIYEIPFEEED